MKPYTYVPGGHYYNVDWLQGELFLTQRQENGELYFEPGFYKVSASNWTDMEICPMDSTEFSRMEAIAVSTMKCTCGLDAVGGGRHSDWCDKAGV